MRTLFANAVADRTVRRQRMTTAGLLEPPDQDVVFAVDEQETDR